MDAEELLEKAKDGVATKRELAVAAEILRDHAGKDSTHTLIHALGRANANEYEPIVAEYLHSPDDPMLARIALLTLCRYWGLVARYEDILFQFVSGVGWDDGGDVRLTAIFLLGDLLVVNPRADVKLKLNGILFDENERMTFRTAAYSALATGMGIPARDIHELSSPEDIATVADPKVLSWACR